MDEAATFGGRKVTPRPGLKPWGWAQLQKWKNYEEKWMGTYYDRQIFIIFIIIRKMEESWYIMIYYENGWERFFDLYTASEHRFRMILDDFGETSWFINTSGTLIRHINICRIYIYSDWYQHYQVNLVSSKDISKDNFLIHLVMFFRHHPASNATWFAGILSKIWIRWLRWWSPYHLVMANIAMENHHF